MLVGYLLDRNDRVRRDGGSSENQGGRRGQHFFIDRIGFASFLGKNLGGRATIAPPLTGSNGPGR